MDPVQLTERRSERKRKKRESYSPDRVTEDSEKKKAPRGLGKSKANRLFDILPNGEPFSCHMCTSPYVVNPMAKGSKKVGRSRHTPLPKLRKDKVTGKDMMLCNACVYIYDRPKRYTAKPVCVPSEEEKKVYMEQVDRVLNMLKSEYSDPEVERLFCPLSQKKLCGCLQKYILTNEGKGKVPQLLEWIHAATELRKEKCYPVMGEKKKTRLIGLGNGHKKSKRYEEFVIDKRRTLKDNMRLCERATQKILLYSNNFLHKRLKTENRPCRIERTRGKAALGQLPEFHKMPDMNCCTDHCVMLAVTHRWLLQDWRNRAQQGQAAARRVMAEMLTPAGATHINCYTFISMVTGCSPSTIARVSSQMLFTGGNREPPEHGMKRVWQEHYKNNKTSQDSSQSKCSEESRQVVSGAGHTVNTLTGGSHLQQEAAVSQPGMLSVSQACNKQQPQSSANNIPSSKSNVQDLHLQILEPKQIEHLMNQGQTVNNKQKIDHAYSVAGRFQFVTGQNPLQQLILHPPPVYGIDLTNMEQSKFPVSFSQANYLATGENQFVPVLPVYQATLENSQTNFGGIHVSNSSISDIISHFTNQVRNSQMSADPLVSVESHSLKSSSNMPSVKVTGPVLNSTILEDPFHVVPSVSTPMLKQYQIVTGQGLLQIQVDDSAPLFANLQNLNAQFLLPQNMLSSTAQVSGLAPDVNISSGNLSLIPNAVESLGNRGDALPCQTSRSPQTVAQLDTTNIQRPIICQEGQQTNQTELYLPLTVNSASSSNKRTAGNEETRIQICFQTCADSSQPLLAADSPAMEKYIPPLSVVNTNSILNDPGHQSVVPGRDADCRNLVHKEQSQESDKQQIMPKKLRNPSGQSGSVTKSGLVGKEHGPELYGSKVGGPLSKSRQPSGSSEGDRSRKSSGNSLLSEISSHGSGLTLSNFPSPNIFLDADKGIFFVQSVDGVEMTEIDSSCMAEYMQSLENMQTGCTQEHTTRNQSGNTTNSSILQFVNQSANLESITEDKSRITTIKAAPEMANSVNDKKISFMEREQIQGKKMHKIIDKQNHQSRQKDVNTKNSFGLAPGDAVLLAPHVSQKQTNDKISGNTSKKYISNKQSAFVRTTHQDKVPSLSDVNCRSKSFVPIAPKGVPSTRETSSASSFGKGVSHRTPVLSSLLSKQPLYRT